MKHRTPAFAVHPVHRSGMRAQPLIINAETYQDAKKEAARRCHLCNRYPETWTLH